MARVRGESTARRFSSTLTSPINNGNGSVTGTLRATPGWWLMSAVAQGPASLPRLLAGLDESGAMITLAEHERLHGRLPRPAPRELIEVVERSGLRGRGGADFPTAREAPVRRRDRGAGAALVVNGSETEPASDKDRLLLTRLPHLVLDGAVLAARAIGAREVIVKVGDGRLRFDRRLRSRARSVRAPR